MIHRAVARLHSAGIENPRLDADVLFMSVAGVDRVHLYLMLREPVAPSIASRYMNLVERRAAGEPAAYLTGIREFMGLEFVVDRRVLIPRPETEGLVERALSWLSSHPRASRIVDVGTGSGAIALSIAQLAPESSHPSIIASDVSSEALAVARINRARLGATSVQFVCGSLLDWSRQRFDMIVANLPYLREEQRHAGIAREPDMALYAEDGGFRLYSELLRQSVCRLAPRGIILSEIDPLQRDRATCDAQHAFPAAEIRVEPDLAGRDRYLIVESAA